MTQTDEAQIRRLRRCVKAQAEMIEALRAMNAAYRTMYLGGGQRRGAAAADKIDRARARLEKAAAALADGDLG